jgi:hypothetical protein
MDAGTALRRVPRLALPVLAIGSLLAPGHLHTQEPTDCAAQVFRLPERMAGVWQELTVTPDGEVLAGELSSSFEAGGCAFSQRFRSADGALTFRSLAFVDRTSGRWRERYVLSNGRTAVYEWVPDGDDILQLRVEPPPVPGGETYRLRISKIGTGSYEVLEEHSSDGGVTWTPGERTITRRLE